MGMVMNGIWEDILREWEAMTQVDREKLHKEHYERQKNIDEQMKYANGLKEYWIKMGWY